MPFTSVPKVEWHVDNFKNLEFILKPFKNLITQFTADIMETLKLKWINLCQLITTVNFDIFPPINLKNVNLCFEFFEIILKCNTEVAQAQCFDIPLRGASCQSLNETLTKITHQLLLLSPLTFKRGYFHRGMVVLNMEQTNGHSWSYGKFQSHPEWCPPNMSKINEETGKTTFLLHNRLLMTVRQTY